MKASVLFCCLSMLYFIFSFYINSYVENEVIFYFLHDYFKFVPVVVSILLLLFTRHKFKVHLACLFFLCFSTLVFFKMDVRLDFCLKKKEMDKVVEYFNARCKAENCKRAIKGRGWHHKFDELVGKRYCSNKCDGVNTLLIYLTGYNHSYLYVRDKEIIRIEGGFVFMTEPDGIELFLAVSVKNVFHLDENYALLEYYDEDDLHYHFD